MAKPITSRSNTDFMQIQDDVQPQAIPLWNEPKGINLEIPLSRLGPDGTPYVNNFKLNPFRRYRVRGGVEALGAAGADAVVGLIVASTEDALEYITRVRKSGVDIYSGAAWVACSGPVLNISDFTFVEFSFWDGKLLFNDPESGLYELDLALQTYTLIAAAPKGFHLTTFGGRVIISNIVGNSTRIQWPVKNDSTDWSGLGSGFEDMRSAPGGVIDIQQGIFPLTDTEALVIRSSSIWIMQLTGFSDAPFAFFQRFSEGTDAPQTIRRLPNQEIAMLGREDVVIVSPGGIRSIGLPVRNQLLGTNYDVRNAVAVYDSKALEYRLYVPPIEASTESIVWRYHFPTQTWHRDTWPFVTRRLAAGNAKVFTPINQLTGLINALAGPINQLGVLGREAGVLIALEGNYVGRESQTGTTDLLSTGLTQAVPVEIQSGLIQPGGPLSRVHMLNVQLEYTSTRAIDVTLEISTDGGSTWEAYGSISLPVSSIPRITAYRKSIEREQFALRLTSLDAVGLELITAYAVVTPGALINL